MTSPPDPTNQTTDTDSTPDVQETEVKYDFTRPVGLGTKFSQNLTTVGESFAKQLGFNLASFLRSNVDVEFKSVSQMLFRDYMGEFSNPSCIGIFSASPLKGQAAVRF